MYQVQWHICEDNTDMKLQWNQIDWKKAEEQVNRLQIRIVKATLEQKLRLVKRLQYLITNSFYAKALAVKRVVSNRGKKTPGIDGELWKSDKEKVNAVRSLDCQTYHAKPLKRVYIEKFGRKEKRLRVSIHLVLGILILGILGLCFYKYKTFGNRITQEDIDAIPTPENPEIETYDYFTANPMQDDGTFPEDDGVTTVVCFGNAPFADDKDSDSSVCSLFAKDSQAVVYNYAVADSLLAAHENPFTTDYPMDAFSFSYLISSLVSGDKTRLEDAYASMENVPAGLHYVRRQRLSGKQHDLPRPDTR